MNIRHSKAYEELALHAGREAGQASPTPATVAEDPAARAIRKRLVEEYEAKLLDTQTYTLRDIQAWLLKFGVELSEASVNRDRQAQIVLLEEQEKEQARRRHAYALAAVRAREAVAAAKDSGNDILTAALAMGQQAVYEYFCDFDPEILADLKPGQIVSLLDVMNRLLVGREQAGLLKARMATLQAAFAKEVKARAAKAGDGRLSQKDVDEISEAVFGPGR